MTMPHVAAAAAAPPAVAARPVRPAATLLVVRDGAAGMEVLMLRRSDASGDRNSGAAVFPGGVLDAHDRALHAWCAGVDDAEASRRLGVAAHGLDYHICAIRECFEEAGLLYASDAEGRLVDLDALGADVVAELRQAARRSALELQRLCERMQLRLAADRLAYLAYWLTPPGLPKRFDTRFFVALCPPGQTALHDGDETVAHFWLRPADALDAARGLKLVNVTRHVLQSIAGFASAEACVAHARQLRDIAVVMPRIAVVGGAQRPLHPREPAYAEVGRLDPDGRGDALAEIVAGTPVRLSPRVLRVTAPNPGVMTGPGTNSYLVGGGSGDWAVIDPGPDDAAHVAALLAAAPGPIRHILVTHTHRDHSPGAQRLRAATGAALLGRTTPHRDGQDASFVPNRTLSHGDTLAVGDATLRVLHTPGHASNHLCFLLEEEKLLFTGDHVMQGSTVVINPPDGDMAAYLASLEALLGEDIDWLAPGHGFLVARPHEVVRALLRHRLHREARVAAALREVGPADLPTLVKAAYVEVPERLHQVAQRSLLAHLLKLAADGRAAEAGGTWRALGAAPTQAGPAQGAQAA